MPFHLFDHVDSGLWDHGWPGACGNFVFVSRTCILQRGVSRTHCTGIVRSYGYLIASTVLRRKRLQRTLVISQPCRRTHDDSIRRPGRGRQIADAYGLRSSVPSA
jgi:hypothetical protein